MQKELIVSSNSFETKVAILEDDLLSEIFIERNQSKGILGNIYKGRVTRVLPGMQSAFVDIGLERDAFLYVSDFFEDTDEFERIPSDEQSSSTAVSHSSPVGSREDRSSHPGKSRRERDRPSPKKPVTRARESKAKPTPSNQESGIVMDAIPSASEFPTDAEVKAALEQWFAEARPESEKGTARPKPTPRKTPIAKRPSSRVGPESPVPQAAGRTTASGKPPVQAETPTQKEPETVQPIHAPDSPPPGQSQASDSDSPPQTPTPIPLEPAAVAAPIHAPEPAIPQSTEKVGADDSPAPIQGSLPSEVVARPERAPSADSETEQPALDLPAAAEVKDFEIIQPEGDTNTTGSETTKDDDDAQASLRNPRDKSFYNQQGDQRKSTNRRRPPTRRRNSRSDGNHKNSPRQTISELLKEGQEIMVQVAKEPIARKGARLTSYSALPGRFMVYMPTVEHIGVSRKIESDAERLRLRKLVDELRGKEIPGGFIVRTAGENHSDEEIESDIRYLHHMWEEIRSKHEKAKAPALVHSELGLVQRIIRDHLSDDFRAIRVDDEIEYERILEFVNRYQPSLINRIKLFTKNKDIFDEYGVNVELSHALEPKIWLKSGGYIVINQTEALVAIDVNTGKYVGKSDSLEETITRTNLEAVKEVVRQIRLRDLGGIIVIDFIDMDAWRNRQKVMDALHHEMTKDKAPSKVLDFNEFGLISITRKRVKQSLEKILCQACPYCGGSGMVKSVTTVCYQIHSEIQKMARSLQGDEFSIRTHPEVARALRNSESKVLHEIEAMVGREITIKQDSSLHLTQFDIIV